LPAARQPPADSSQAGINQELLTSSGEHPVTKILSTNELVHQSTARNGFNALFTGVLRASARAAIGIYGLKAYRAEQRHAESGVEVCATRRAVGKRGMSAVAALTLERPLA